MIWGAIAGAVVGGLISRKNAKDARKASLADARDSLPRLRASAEAAGFNPLTALENGGLGPFMNIASGVAPLASSEVIERVVTGIEDRVTGRDAQAKATESAYHELMQIQLERAKAGGGYPIVKDTAVAGATGLAGPFSTRPALGGNSKPVPLSPQKIPQDGDTMRTNPFPLTSDADFYIDPRNPDAEHGEQRYGDIAQEVMGLNNAVSDFKYNNLLSNVRKRFGDAQAQMLHDQLSVNPKMDVDDYLKKLEIELLRGTGHVPPPDDGTGTLDRDQPGAADLIRKRNDFLRKTTRGGYLTIN